ncbi:YybH family protein [Microbacterium sp. NPDC058062]|uniref:YybH family protein n=1 Tax=Microbacterium sp. NPDC058062 TaxID=3346320 RepID=UPI0036DAAC70
MSDRESIIADAQRWLDGYRRAWASNDADDIRAIFTDGAEYRYEPWVEPLRGQDAIVASWLDRQDEPGSWSFEGRVVGVDGRLAFIQGETEYTSGRRYSNLWVVTLADDGRAESFTEWWMDRSKAS